MGTAGAAGMSPRGVKVVVGVDIFSLGEDDAFSPLRIDATEKSKEHLSPICWTAL